MRCVRPAHGRASPAPAPRVRPIVAVGARAGSSARPPEEPTARVLSGAWHITPFADAVGGGAEARVRDASEPAALQRLLRHPQAARLTTLRLPPACPPAFLEALAQAAPGLQHVHAHRPRASGAGALAQALAGVAHLRTLVLAGGQRARAGRGESQAEATEEDEEALPASFITPLVGHPTLETVSLIACGLRGAAAGALLGELACGCPRLVSLWLGLNPLGEEGGRALAPAMQRWRGARWLSLEAAGLGDRGAVSVAYAARACASLALLDLRRNGLSASGLAALHQLRERFPALQPMILERLPGTGHDAHRPPDPAPAAAPPVERT